MARPRASLPAEDVLRALLDAEGRLAVKVTPGARVEALEVASGRLLAKVRAKPEDGKANEAVRALVAEAYGVGVSRVELVRGSASRDKVFRIKE